MPDQLFPRQIDNNYRGTKVALWLFGLVLFVRSGIGANSIINSDRVASTADGIPIHAFPPAAVQIVLFMFAAWGLAQLVISVIGVLALIRYRALVPLMFALFLLEHVSRKLVGIVRPVTTVGTPRGFYVNLLLLTLMVAGVALSFRYGRVEAA